MDDFNSLAKAWLDTPGADEAIRLIVALKREGHPPAVQMAAEATAMSFLKGWLKAWVGEGYSYEVFNGTYGEVLKEGARRWPS